MVQSDNYRRQLRVPGRTLFSRAGFVPCIACLCRRVSLYPCLHFLAGGDLPHPGSLLFTPISEPVDLPCFQELTQPESAPSLPDGQ